MKATRSEAHEALIKAHRYFFGRTDASRLKRNELCASLSRGKGSVGLGHENVAGIRLGIDPGTGKPHIRLLVHKKATPSALAKRGVRTYPASFSGIATRVEPIAKLSAAGIQMGARIRVKGGETHDGTLTACLPSEDGRLWLISCAHVLALLSDPPVKGAGVISSSQLIGALAEWTELTTGDSFDADVAICRPGTGVEFSPAWPDGRALAGTGPLPTTGSRVTLFSPTRPAGVEARVAGQRKTVVIALPDGDPVSYVNQVPICAIDGGIVADFRDSGSPIRDVNDKLVGMVIAKDDDGKTAWCTPWPTVQTRLDELAANVA